jgi:predicted NAD/FAD-binding protein
MERMNIAVIGAGVSGLSAAWLLSKRHAVSLYEAGSYVGGHANTVDVATSDGMIAVDTGFIVYNDRNYPNLCALFQHLNVPTRPAEMSFAITADGGAYEYAGAGFNGFFGQRRNLARPSHWRLLRDIQRFFRESLHRVGVYPAATGLGAFLEREGYSDAFVHNHILPMGAAIWSSSAQHMLAFPARHFVQFYANHGMLQFKNRPLWRTVTGGSRIYVNRLVADTGLTVEIATRAVRVFRQPEFVRITDDHGVVRLFDHVVLATHADQALELLAVPSAAEKSLLPKFSYQTNLAVLHRDPRWMPRRRRLWSSWNYLKDSGDKLCVTYWMNRLQGLNTDDDLFVTLNPTDDIHPKAVVETFEYRHPAFTPAAMAAQYNLSTLQGEQRTWFCGSYFGYGFHEDGVRSGLDVAERLGRLPRPWQLTGVRGATVPAIAHRLEAAE